MSVMALLAIAVGGTMSSAVMLADAGIAVHGHLYPWGAQALGVNTVVPLGLMRATL